MLYRWSGIGHPINNSTFWEEKMNLFGKKDSVDWHLQIDYAAGKTRPTDPHFPFDILRSHTDNYLKKKRKSNQQAIDSKLASLIHDHDDTVIAIAACAHAMSPKLVRALINFESETTPFTYFTLPPFLECLIAAHYANPQSVTEFEAQWAQELLPFARSSIDAPAGCLQGICRILEKSRVRNMIELPDFYMIAQRALEDFPVQVDGYKNTGAWVEAHQAVAWLSDLDYASTSWHMAKGLRPESLLDQHFPSWRIWARWKPNQDRLKVFASLTPARRSVLAELLALEGPDFGTGKHETMRDGLISQYKEQEPFMRHHNILIEVPSQSKEELKTQLCRIGALLEIACTTGESAIALFVHVCILESVKEDGLKLLESANLNSVQVHKLLLEFYGHRNAIGAGRVLTLKRLLLSLEGPSSEALRNALLQFGFIQAIENCLSDYQKGLRRLMQWKDWPTAVEEIFAFLLDIRKSAAFFPLLKEDFQLQLSRLPDNKVLETAIDIYRHLHPSTQSPPTRLEQAIEAYILHHLIGVAPEAYFIGLVEDMVRLWVEPQLRGARLLAISIANSTEPTVATRCLRQIPFLNNDFVRHLQVILKDYRRVGILKEFQTDPVLSIVRLSRLLAGNKQYHTLLCFRPILSQMIKEHKETVIKASLQTLKASEWLEWMRWLKSIYTGDDETSPLQRYYERAHSLIDYEEVITRLEEFLGPRHEAIQCILTGFDDPANRKGNGHLILALEALRKSEGQKVEPLTQKLAGSLRVSSDNHKVVSYTLKSINMADSEGWDACQRIVEALEVEKKPKVVVEALLASYLANPALGARNKAALGRLGRFLGLKVYNHGMPDDQYRIVVKYYEDEEAKVFEEAARLEALKRALKAKDRRGTLALLRKHGIKDTNPLDEELETLPPDVRPNVDLYGENEVELTFPLPPSKKLLREAMGGTNANALIVRLVFDLSEGLAPSFCCHLDNEPDFNQSAVEHLHWEPSCGTSPPERQFCRGRVSPLTWQMNRHLHHYFLKRNPDIYSIYKHISKRLKIISTVCIVCGQTHPASQGQLYRLTTCTGSGCSRTFSKAPLDVRFPEIRFDPLAIDFILTSLHAAALTLRKDLLPTCPFDIASVLTILNTFPPTTTLQTCTDLEMTLKSCHKDAEKLLTWACTNSGNFLTSAPDTLKIPGFGDYQFVLASKTSERETEFTAKLSRYNARYGSGKILFHGTALDRLPSILAGGLRVCSGTPLQRTGAAHGHGIYMAEDPATSFSYSTVSPTRSWNNSALHGVRVLLGCEVAGNGNPARGSPGVHVIQDPNSVMLRYVFLFKEGNYTVPGRNQCEPPMVSAFLALRKGWV